MSLSEILGKVREKSEFDEDWRVTSLWLWVAEKESPEQTCRNEDYEMCVLVHFSELCLCVSVSVTLSVYLSFPCMCLCVCMSVCVFVCLWYSVYMSVQLNSWELCLSMCDCVSVSASVCLSVRLCNCVCLYVSVCRYLSMVVSIYVSSQAVRLSNRLSWLVRWRQFVTGVVQHVAGSWLWSLQSALLCLVLWVYHSLVIYHYHHHYHRHVCLS